MPRFLAILTSVAITLWLGGMIFLFIAVQSLFSGFPKQTSDVAVQAAPRLFTVFERYQLALAGVAVIASFGWYLVIRLRRVGIIFILILLTSVAATISTTVITSKMEALRHTGQSGSPEFMKLHGQSMIFYVAEAGLLLVAAIMLPLVLGARRDTSRETAPA